MKRAAVIAGRILCGLSGILMVLCAGAGRDLYARDASFERGNSNGDETLDVSDPISVLLSLFSGEPGLPCEDAADSNDDGAVNIAYSAQLQESSACGNGVWALAAGTMPPGVNLFADGRLSGTPNTAGTFSFVVVFQEGGVSDSPGRTTDKSFTIAVRF